MTIYQKPNGYWYYDFYVDGVRHTGPTHEKQKGRAETYAAIKRTEATERRMPPGMRKVPTLAKYAEGFKKDVEAKKEAGHLAHNTARYYLYGCELLEATSLWNLRLDRIDAAAVEKISFPSSATGNTALRTLRHMLHQAEDAKLLYRAPKFKLFEDVKRVSVVEPWLEELMLAEAKEPLRTVIIIMLDAFMRPAEVVAMKWEDIRWEQGQIWIPESKTEKGKRFVGITSRMHSALQSRRPTISSSRWVFPATWLVPSSTTTVGHMWPTSLNKMWGVMRQKVTAKVHETNPTWQWPKDLVLYSCRHTGITGFSKMVGGNPWRVAKAAGHADLKTTGRYTHPEDNMGAIMDSVNEGRVVEFRKKRA